MASTLQDILDRARANATDPVPAGDTNLPVAAKPQGRLLSREDLGGSFSADVFLKVTDAGIKLGNKGQKYHGKLYVTIDTGAVQWTRAIKASSPGGDVKYWRTHDGVSTIDGQPWSAAIAEAEGIQPGTRTYKSADIPLRLIEQVEDVTPDKVLGISLSTTNFAIFDRFYDEVKAKGTWGQEVVVELGFEIGKKQNKRDWGLFTFKYEGLATALDVAA